MNLYDWGMTASMDVKTVSDVVSTTWNDELIAELSDYIAIPALSPAFDPHWEGNGYLHNAVDHVHSWIKKQPIVGMTSRIAELPERTPVIVAEVPAFGDTSDNSSTVLLYGHCDKQPEMVGWEPDLGPWKPVLREGRLYGRGGADDGYAAYASLTAIRAVQEAGGSHPRCVLLIEASEESGSPDLPAHVTALAETLGVVKLVVCLDSGCGDYEALWLTSSLRGMMAATVTVEVLSQGVHSGGASGVVPSSFRILRQLLDRIEDAETGAVLLPSATTETPDYRLHRGRGDGGVLGSSQGAVPATRRCPPDGDWRGGSAEQDMATDPLLCGGRRYAAASRRRECPPAVDGVEVIAPPSAQCQRLRRAERTHGGPHHRPAERCSSHPVRCRTGLWVECSRSCAMAPVIARIRVTRCLRRTTPTDGRRGKYSLHGNARRQVSDLPVCGDGCSRAAIERSRTQ